jgi:hypothetical protein
MENELIGRNVWINEIKSSKENRKITKKKATLRQLVFLQLKMAGEAPAEPFNTIDRRRG